VPEETAVASERLDKHVSAAKNTRATTEETTEAVFSMRSAPRQYKEVLSSASGRKLRTGNPVPGGGGGGGDLDHQAGRNQKMRQ
jgi:hypothetical protein